MTTKQRYTLCLAWFAENMPVAESELHFDSPFQLLVAVILSAQCTDKRVNMVTPALFEKFPTPEALAAASFEEVYPSMLPYIRYQYPYGECQVPFSSGFWSQKSL